MATKKTKNTNIEVEETLLEIIKDPIGGGWYKYVIIYVDKNSETKMVSIPVGGWNRSVVIDALIRSKYSQDHVEAIINNHFLNISEWLDLKFKGEDVTFEDVEYNEFQRWRKRCKTLADEVFSMYPEVV